MSSTAGEGAFPESHADDRDRGHGSAPASGVPAAPGAPAGRVVDALTEQLSSLRRDLDGVLAHTDALIYAKDLQGRYTMANRAMLDVLGRRECDVLGRTDHELFPPAAAAQFTLHDRQVVDSGDETRYEESVRQPDGTSRTFLSTKFPMRDEAGAIYAVGGVSADITESVRVRRELAASQLRWRALVDSSPVSIAVFGALDLRFVYANARAAEVFGVAAPADLIGRAYVDVIPEEGRPAFRERLAHMLAGGTVNSVRIEIVGFDGRRRAVEVTATMVSFDELPAIQVEIRDVTARKAAEEALRMSEERFRMLWEHSPVGVVEADIRGVILSVNPSLCELVGRSSAELVGQASLVMMPMDVDVRMGVLQAADQLREGCATQLTLETTYEHSSGRPVPVLVTVGLLGSGDDEERRFIATVIDVTARRQAEEDLRASEVLLRTAFHNAPNGMLLLDGEGRLVQANPALCSLLGLTEAELKDALEGLQAVHPEDRDALLAAVEQAEESGSGTASIDLRLLDKANRAHWVSVSLALLVGPHGVANVLVQVQDIAERQAAHERLTHRATHDALTELPNRVLLSQRIKRALDERMDRPDNQDMALLFLDLDGFKAINDTHGHAVGDEVLIEVGRRLQHAVRPTDLVARLGGDEFVVLCDHLPHADEARRIAERLRGLIARPMQSTCGQLQVAVSIGISHADEDLTAEQLLGKADAAMYAEKRYRRRRAPGRLSVAERRPA